MELKEAIRFKTPPFIQVDRWIPDKGDELLKSNKGAIYVPVTQAIFNQDDPENPINWFILSPKKCYNSDEMRPHICLYINYFEKYYDPDKEYFSNLSHIKYMIDYYEKEYTKEAFLFDLERYIYRSGLYDKIYRMVMDNYYVALKYKNPKNPALEYTDDHGRILMHMSIMMNMSIPLLTHFAYKRKVDGIDDFLLEAFDRVFTIFKPTVDMYSKLYETSVTNIREKSRNDEELWAKQDIRGINVVTHAQTAVKNIILNLMPKYVFSSSVVSLNFVSIKNCTKYTIDTEYEYSFIDLSSSKRDDDSTSEFDKFEAQLIRQDELI